MNFSGRVTARPVPAQPVRRPGSPADPFGAAAAGRIPAPTYPIHYPRVTLPTVPAAQDLERFGRSHRTSIVMAVVALLAGTGITAVAVAPLTPDAARLPQRLVVETVVPTGLQSQLDALAAQDLQLTRSDITRGTDTVDALLTRLGVRDPSAAQFLRTDFHGRQVVTGRGGKLVQANTTADGSLQDLVLRYPSDQSELSKSHFNRVTVVRGPDGRWMSNLRSVPYESQTRLASGTIRSSLFGATDEAGVPDSVAAELADIFSTDIDFHRELRKGDTFSVVYESLTADAQPVPWNEGAGRVLAAEFINGGRAHHAVWFAPPNGRGGYFGVDGQSKQRAFLASPMEFSRVTSGFAMRFHPLMQSWRRHLGVDYGAPVGTPVRAVAEGVVDFSGWQNGYGNVVQVNHGKGKTTLYAHLSRRDVKVGQRVQQAHRLGAVGMTGWTTGPHLHFEFRINGQHQDPLRVAKTAESVELDAALRPQFVDVVRTVQAKLEVADTLLGRRGSNE